MMLVPVVSTGSSSVSSEESNAAIIVRPLGIEAEPVESSGQRAPLAQLAEQLTLNQRVRGSSP